MLPFLLAALLALPGTAAIDAPALAEPGELVEFGPALDLDWAHFARTGDLRVAEGPDAEDLEDRDLYPLGDADDDGRADVLAVMWYEEEVVFQALSGRDGSILWERSLEDDDDGYFAVMGDVDKDDVLDLVYLQVDYDGSYGGVFLGQDIQETFEITYEVLDGSDLSPMFTWTAEGEFTWTFSSTPYYQQEEFRYRIPSLAPHPDLPGAIEYTIDWHEQADNDQDVAGLVTVGHQDQRFAVSLRGIDMEGAETWYSAADEEGTYFFITGLYDVDGDDVRDFILTGFQYIPADSITAAGASILFYPDSEDKTQVFGRVYDGAAGTELLDWSSGLRTGPTYVDGLVLPAGDRNGEGQEYAILLEEFTYTADLLGNYDYDIDFTLLFLDSDGNEIESHSSGELLVAAVFADVDGDGDDELELLRAPLKDTPYGPYLDLDNAEYGIAQGDLSYVWSKADLEDDFPAYLMDAAYAPDFTGDGIPESIWVDADYDWVAARDGTDGSELWRFELDEDEIQYLDLGPDFDDDGGVDLLWAEFEQDEDSDDAWTRITGGNLTAIRGSDGETFWMTSLYAQQDNMTVGPYPILRVYDADDMDGDGAPDLLVNLEGIEHGWVIVCQDDYCEYEEVEAPDDVEVIDLAFPLSGLHGDDLGLDARSAEDYGAYSFGGPSAGPAQSDLEEAHDAPAAGILPLLAFLGVALYLRRR